MKVLVCGGRDFKDYEFIWETLDEILNPQNLPLPESVEIIHGGAPGVDSFAGDWACLNWIKESIYRPNWKSLGKAAGPIRNQQMLEEGKPDLIIAFPGGRGTEDMIGRAQKAGVEIRRVAPGQPL